MDCNCDVLIEKPCTISFRAFKILEEKAIKNNKFIFPAYHQLYRSETLSFIPELFDSFGNDPIHKAEIQAGNNNGVPQHTFKDGFNKRINAGGGVLLDLGSHYLALLFYYF